MIKRLIILLLVISGIFFFWKSQKKETIQPKENVTQTEDKEKTEDKAKEDSETSSLLDKLKKESEEKKKELTADEPEPKKTEKTETPKDKIEEREKKPSTETKTSKKSIKKPSTTPIESKEIADPTPVASIIPNIETKIKVYLYEWDIDLSQKAIPSGTVIFEVHNTGRFTHDFAIRGVDNFGKVRPNETRVFSTRIRGGKYMLYSERGKDAEKNMVEDFVIFE